MLKYGVLPEERTYELIAQEMPHTKWESDALTSLSQPIYRMIEEKKCFKKPVSDDRKYPTCATGPMLGNRALYDEMVL